MASVQFISAQQIYWTLPSKKLKVDITTPTNTIIAGANSLQHRNANGAYDVAGNMLFYVKDNSIMNPSSLEVGSLLPYFGGPFPQSFTEVGPEIAIVPVPGGCKSYYVIYTMSNDQHIYKFLMYMKVDCSSGNPVVTSPTAVTSPISYAAVPINTNHTDAGRGIAVSKLSGSVRYLFFGGENKILRYTISETGIDSEIIISSSMDEPTLFSQAVNESHELELSPNQEWLAWGNSGLSKLCVLKLNSSYTKIPSASKTYTISGIRGIEFNNDASKIYMSNASNGISFAILSGNNIPSNFPSSSLALNNTFLELAKNGKIYGVNNSGQLIPLIESPAGIGNPVPNIVLTSNKNVHITSVYRLNDQIDGDDYSFFFGTALPTAGFTINSSSPTICNSPLQTYQCASAPITLVNTSINATSYKIEVSKASTSCGTYNLVHSTGVVTTFPTNAKNLPGGSSGNYIQNNVGFYKLVLTAYNSCNQTSSQTLYINVATAPSGVSSYFNTKAKTRANQTILIDGCLIPANQEFMYVAPESGIDLSCNSINGYRRNLEHSNINNPNIVGRDFTTFDFPNISGGTGSLNYQTFIKAERWNGSTYIPLDNTTLYPDGEDLGVGTTSMSLANMLKYDNSNPNYGAFTNPSLTPNGTKYRITLTVKNMCGSYPTSQIIQINDQILRRFITLDDIVKNLNLQTFPIPARDEISFKFDALENDLVSIDIFYLDGRKAMNVVDGFVAVQGSNTVTSQIGNLMLGTYNYKLNINGTVVNGTFIKI